MSDKFRFEDHIDPDALDFLSLDEKEVQDLRADCILKEVSNFREVLETKRDRMKYYDETVTLDDIDLYLSELKRIERDLG